MTAIEFEAVVYKVQTLVDNGIRLTLDLPETAILQMAQLAECQRFGSVLSITVATEAPTKRNISDDTTRQRRKRAVHDRE